MKKIGLICLAVVLALGVLGVSFGMWDKTLFIDGTVETGDFDIIFTKAVSNDPPVDTFLDPKEAGEWTLVAGEPTWSDEAGETWDKDVGSLEVTGASGTTLTVTLDNGYPGYFPSVGFTIDNPGTIPAKIESIQIDGEDYTCPVQVYFDFDNDGNIDTELRMWGIDVGQQIDPGDEVLGHLDLRIYDSAAMEASQGIVDGSFEVTIVTAQWNEVTAKTLNVPSPSAGGIQDAIDAASAGDTVIVSAGTYEPSGNFVIPDGVTLKLQSGVIVKFPMLMENQYRVGGGFIVEAGGTLLADGVKICKQDAVDWAGVLVKFKAGSSGHVKNSKIQQGQIGVEIDGASGITIENNRMQIFELWAVQLHNDADGNTIEGNTCFGSAGEIIIIMNSSDNTIIGNTLHPYWYATNNGIHVLGYPWEGRYARNNKILNNTFKGEDPYSPYGTMTRGITLNWGAEDTIVHGNKVYGILYHGISLWDSPVNTTITGNEIYNNGETGIILESRGQYRDGATGVHVHYNNIYGNAQYGIKVEYALVVEPVHAENNWWGDPSGPAPVGTGDEVFGNVLYDPWATAPFE